MSQTITTAVSCVGNSLNYCSGSVISNEMYERTEAVVRGLDLLLEHHGASNLVRDELRNQVHLSLDTSETEMVWLKRIKFLTTYPLAKYLKNDPPPSPDLAFKPTGALRAWMRQRIVSINRKNTHLWCSWLQTKRAALCLSEEYIEETYEKHLATLTKADPGINQTIQMILKEPSFEQLLEQTAVNVFDHYYNTQRTEWVAPDFTENTPSGSACFEKTRKRLGQYGRLKERSETPDFCPLTELVEMKLIPSLCQRNGRRSNVTIEIRRPCGEEEWKSLKNDTIQVLLELFENRRLPSATIQGVLEPLKVRVISKGEAIPYYYCKPLQKSLLSAIQKFSSFRLTGRPICPTDLIDLARKADSSHHWFSIDYSAATDGLSWKYSSAILKTVTKYLPAHVRLAAYKVLGPHELHYPQSCGGVWHKGTQTNGQLMGSILSFPILCLANMGVYFLSTQNEQSGWSFKERLEHVLVNGDDMLYTSHPDNWSDHVKIAGDVGLDMSVGKAYSSPFYANANSTSFHYDLRVKSSPWQIDYLNTGLFFGQHKVQRSDDPKAKLLLGDTEVLQMSKLDLAKCSAKNLIRELTRSEIDPDDMMHNMLSPLNWILRGALPGKAKILLMKFLSVHKEKIRAEQMCLLQVDGKKRFFSRNLFIPIPLGGMGIEKPPGFKDQVKPIQKKVALSIIQSYPDLIHNSSRPVLGYEVEKVEPLMNVPWRRSILASEIPQRVLSDLRSSNIKKGVFYSFQNILTSSNSVSYTQ